MNLRLIISALVIMILTACAQAAPASPTAAPEAFDLALQRAALLPACAGDLERLPTVTRYHIRLVIDVPGAQVSGHQDVLYTNTENVPLPEIYFRLFPATPGYGGAMTVTHLTLNRQPQPVYLEQNGSAVRLPLAEPLRPGGSVSLSLDFTVSVPRNNAAGYAQLNSTADILTLPNVYPIIPAYDQQGWHIELSPGYGDAVYSDTALYQVEIDAPPGMVITTGWCRAPQSVAGGLRWQCASGPARDFMLAYTDRYEMATQEVEGVVIRSFYLPQHADAGKKALDYAVRAVQIYSRRFGPYRFGELDVVETPTLAGGIEYPGLIVIAARLYDDPQELFEWVVAHEVAHQWWYSMIGNDQVNHAWLDEALAQYSTILYYKDAHDQATASFLTNTLFEQVYQAAVRSQQDAPVDQPVGAFDAQAYGVIVYRKAPLFFHALQQEMGEERFEAFLRAYYRQNLYGNATPEQLLEAAGAVLDRASVQRLYGEWIKSKK